MFLLAKINSAYMDKQWHVPPWSHALKIMLTLEKENLAPCEICYQGVLSDDVKGAFDRHASELLDLPKGRELQSPPKTMAQNVLYILDEVNFNNYLTRLKLKSPKKIPGEELPFCELFCINEEHGKFQLKLIPVQDDPMATLYDRRKGSVALVPPFLPSDVSVNADSTTKKYAHEANTDVLTEVTNKKHFEELMKEMPTQEGTIVFLDVDKMGCLNYGNDLARKKVDCLLKHIGTTLRKSVRQSDLVCRRSGDEFILFLCGCESVDAVSVVKRVQANIAKSLAQDKMSAQTTLSAGISQCRMAGHFERSLREAQIALERAKKKGHHHGKIELCTIGDAIQVFKEMSNEKKVSKFPAKSYEIISTEKQIG